MGPPQVCWRVPTTTNVEETESVMEARLAIFCPSHTRKLCRYIRISLHHTFGIFEPPELTTRRMKPSWSARLSTRTSRLFHPPSLSPPPLSLSLPVAASWPLLRTRPIAKAAFKTWIATYSRARWQGHSLGPPKPPLVARAPPPAFEARAGQVGMYSHTDCRCLILGTYR